MNNHAIHQNLEGLNITCEKNIIIVRSTTHQS